MSTSSTFEAPEAKTATEVTLTELVNILCNYRRVQPVTLLLRTSCDNNMPKTDNPFHGRVEKLQRSNVFVNASYTNMVQKRRMKEDPSQEDFVARPAFGLKVDDAIEDAKIAPMVMCGIGMDDKDNRIGLYIAALPQSTCNDDEGNKDKQYIWTSGPQRGQRLTADEVKQLEAKFYDKDGSKQRASSAACQGVSEDDVVAYIKPNILSIEEVKIDGTLYRVIDQTLPPIPDEVREAAVKEVENKRRIRDAKAVIKKACDKQYTQLVEKGGADPHITYERLLRERFAEEVKQELLHPSHVEREVLKAMKSKKLWDANGKPIVNVPEGQTTGTQVGGDDDKGKQMPEVTPKKGAAKKK